MVGEVEFCLNFQFPTVVAKMGLLIRLNYSGITCVSVNWPNHISIWCFSYLSSKATAHFPKLLVDFGMLARRGLLNDGNCVLLIT